MKKVKIIQIAVSSNSAYGLGEDGRPYYWNRTSQEWRVIR